MALGIINEFMPNDAIALGSAGSLPGDMQRLFRPKDRGTYHMEYGYSNMGYEVNGALGAKLACPDKEVYTFCGDGSFLMGHSELYTALQEGLKINVCLFDNMGWGCIENLQNNQGTDTFGTVFRARNLKRVCWTGRRSLWTLPRSQRLRCKGLHLPHLGGAARRTGRRSYPGPGVPV